MKLSPKQMKVYLKMDYTWKSAYELQARLDTLDAIVRKGYAESRATIGHVAFPHNCIYFKRTDKPI